MGRETSSQPVLYFYGVCVDIELWLFVCVDQLVPSSSEGSVSSAGRGVAARRVHSQAADRRRSQPLRQPRDLLQHQVPHCELAR